MIFCFNDNSMLQINNIKLGTVMKIDNEPYVVTWTQHSKQARSGAVLRTKIKNLIDGRVLEKTFQGSDKIEEADLQRGKASYLYKDEAVVYFMDTKDYEQFDIALDQIGDRVKYLKEGSEVDILYFEQNPVSISLPPKVELKVTQAMEGVKGNTAQGKVTKPVTLETGIEINAPLFIKEGDTVRVNTETGRYVERV